MHTPAPELLAELKGVWKAVGVAGRPGATVEAIRTFEKEHGVRLPDDMGKYFMTLDGMPDNALDQHMIRFWPLTEVQRVLAIQPTLDSTAHDGYFVFADYSMWSHAYAIQLAEAPTNDVAIVGGEKPLRVATSFSEFLHYYLRSPTMLFRPDQNP